MSRSVVQEVSMTGPPERMTVEATIKLKIAKGK